MLARGQLVLLVKMYDLPRDPAASKVYTKVQRKFCSRLTF
jgi:hypothetical protein